MRYCSVTARYSSVTVRYRSVYVRYCSVSRTLACGRCAMPHLPHLPLSLSMWQPAQLQRIQMSANFTAYFLAGHQPTWLSQLTLTRAGPMQLASRYIYKYIYIYTRIYTYIRVYICIYISIKMKTSPEKSYLL